MSTISPDLQRIINDFATTEPDIVKSGGLKSIEYQNLMAAIQASPALVDRLNDAVRLGYLKRFDINDDPHAGASYGGYDKVMNLGLDTLRSSTSKSKLIFQIGHEIQHGFFEQESQNAFGNFTKDVDNIAKDSKTEKNYTAPMKDILSNYSENEARAMIAGWNALVSSAQKNHTTPSLEKIYQLGSRYQEYFIDAQYNTATGNEEYRLKSGLTINSDMTMEMSSTNVKKMEQLYFEQAPSQAMLGANGNSDYRNSYGAYFISYIAQVHQNAAPDAKLMLDMKSLKLDEALLEQNGLDLGSQTRVNYYDTKNPNVLLHFDHTVNGSNQNQYVPILREHLQEVQQNRELFESGQDLSHQSLIDEDALKGHFPLSDDIRSIGQAHQLGELQMHRISAIAHTNLPSDRYSVAAVYLSKDEQTLNVHYENRFNAVTFMNKEFDFQQSIHKPIDQTMVQHQQKIQTEQLNQTQTQNHMRL